VGKVVHGIDVIVKACPKFFGKNFRTGGGKGRGKSRNGDRKEWEGKVRGKGDCDRFPQGRFAGGSTEKKRGEDLVSKSSKTKPRWKAGGL